MQYINTNHKQVLELEIIQDFIESMDRFLLATSQDNQSFGFNINVFGTIQGVGFRPFIANLANSLNLHGFVRNISHCVDIMFFIDCTNDFYLTKYNIQVFFISLFIHNQQHVVSKQYILNAGFKDLLDRSIYILSNLYVPKQIFVESIHYSIDLQYRSNNKFDILPSQISDKNTLQMQLPLDFKICNSCLNDMQTRDSRFYKYAFSSCVNCGARYSILYKLPYDRKNTSMKDFKLCKYCENDYFDMSNRRFHTEPISCNNCKINIYLYNYKNKDKDIESYDNDAIKGVAKRLEDNEIILYKGLGGFAYIANAKNDEVIKYVRSIKSRRHKPFVVMAKLNTLKNIAILTEELESVLLSKQAPIVVTLKNINTDLSKEVCNMNTIGVMIPYTPMLITLFEYLPDDFVIIYTSANNKGDMIATNIAQLNLDNITQHIPKHKDFYILDYERDILNKLDDSIFQGIDFSFDNMESHSCVHSIFKLRSIRLSRSFAPLNLRFDALYLKHLCLAFGAMQKSSFAFGKENNIVVSPYMGDLFSVNNIEYFKDRLNFFTHIYGKPDILVADKHMQYESTKIAQALSQQYNIPLYLVSHHHAHLNALLLESQINHGVGVIFDGSGLGDDKSIWGGEFLVGDFKSVERKLYFKPFKILGGEKYIKDCVRLTYSYALSNNMDNIIDFIESRFYKTQEINILKIMQKNTLNAPSTSSVGRLFDIAGFFLGLNHIDYEGQSGEMIASFALQHAINFNKLELNTLNKALSEILTHPFIPYNFTIKDGQIDLTECFESMFLDSINGIDKGIIAFKFIDTLAYIILESLKLIGTNHALFGGGVFVNYLLCLRTKQVLKDNNITYFFPRLPCNDYSISIGQLAFLSN